MSTVPVQLSRLQLSTLEFNRPAPIYLRQAATLQQGYQQALTAQQEKAPALSAVVNGPGVYGGTDGHTYLVPAARLTYRPNLPRTPEIAFSSNGTSWKIVLSLQLFRPPGSDSAAIPLLMNGYSVSITSGDQTPGFTFATVTPFSPPDGLADVVGLLKAEGVIDEALALTLFRDKPNAMIQVTGNLSYRHTFTRPLPAPPPAPPAPPPPPHPMVGPRPLQYARYERIATPTAFSDLAAERMVFRVQPTTETVTEGITADQHLAGISCHFDPGLMDFKPIYAVLMGTNSDGTIWSQQTGQGYTRPSSGPDAYYVLPDSYRMVLDATSGLPAMNLLLVETPPTVAGGSASYSVRVRIGIGPLLDGGRIERMRESLRSSQNILYAQLAIGGYTSANFVLSALFSELPGFQSSVLNGPASAGIDAANGFELVLDCSLEFYTLMAKLLSSADGLQGTVQFKIVTAHVDSTPPVDTVLVVDVPVVLSFLGPFPMKLSSQIGAPSSPDATSLQVQVQNPLPVAVSVDGVYGTLMTTDPDLGITTGATFLKPSDNKIAFAPAEQRAVMMAKPSGGPLSSYTSLAMDFGPATPTFDPAAILNHYQQLVATSGVHASAHFNCYLLKHPDQIPASLANLIGMQVEVQHGDGVVVGVPLTRDNPAMDVAIPYTFAELLAGASLTQPTFRYRAKCIYPDHAGQFSDWISQTGGIVEVTPV